MQGLFGVTQASQPGGLFGTATNTSTGTAFGTGTGLFGQTNTGFGAVGSVGFYTCLLYKDVSKSVKELSKKGLAIFQVFYWVYYMIWYWW